MKIEEYIDKKFNRLTVIGIGEPYISPKGIKSNRLKCVCECGNVVSAVPSLLKSGRMVSCGCRLAEWRKVGFNTKHNLSCRKDGKMTRLYSIWHGMKTRCYNKNATNYEYYGGRGITVCDEWRDDFQAFHDWAMANGYADNLSIDRENNDGNYEPSNCRWITMKEQQVSRRKTTKLTTGIPTIIMNKCNGEQRQFDSLADAAEYLGLTSGALSRSLKNKRYEHKKYSIHPLKYSDERKAV